MANSQVAVVTGASSGIGKSISQKLLDSGFEVWALDLNAPENKSLNFIQVNLAALETLDDVASKLPRKIDVLVNAAGVSGLLPIPTVMRVNFYGLRALTRLVADRIVNGGAVVNVASTSAWFWRDHLEELRQLIGVETSQDIDSVVSDLVPDGYSAYARSKEAVLVWSAMAAQEYLGRFRVNSVSPGPVQTPLLDEFYEAMGHEELDPLTARAGGRNGLPDEIADVVLFLAGSDSRWINGTDLPVDNSAEMSEFLAAQGFIERLVRQ